MTSADERHADGTAYQGAVNTTRFLAVPLPVLDCVIGALLTAFAIWLWIGAASIERSSRGLLGPATFPRGVAVILGVVSLAMAARGALAMHFGGAPVVKTAQPVAVLAAMVLVILYPLLLGHFGYYLVTGPWLLALFFITGNRNPLLMLLCAGGFLLFTKLVFEMLMGISLP